MKQHDASDGDKTTTDYWDATWKMSSRLTMMDPSLPGLDNHPVRHWHRLFADAFAMLPRQRGPLRLMEAGCGGSRWLPYFHKIWGCQVEGLDYSESGCDLAAQILSRSEVQGDIHHADLHQLPKNLSERFDVVYSAGLIEHFDNPDTVIRSMASMLRPGGLMISLVPNMRYLPGLLQRMVDQEVYEAHVPFSLASLIEEHARAEMHVLKKGYLGTINLCAVNASRLYKRKADPLIPHVFSAFSKAVWIMERAGLPSLPTPLLSPHLYCLAKKQSA